MQHLLSCVASANTSLAIAHRLPRRHRREKRERRRVPPWRISALDETRVPWCRARGVTADRVRARDRTVSVIAPTDVHRLPRRRRRVRSRESRFPFLRSSPSLRVPTACDERQRKQGTKWPRARVGPAWARRGRARKKKKKRYVPRGRVAPASRTQRGIADSSILFAKRSPRRELKSDEREEDSSTFILSRLADILVAGVFGPLLLAERPVETRRT